MELQAKLYSDISDEAAHTRYLTFLTDNQLFGLPIGSIVQIVQMQEIIPLPEQPHYIKGIINLRGQIIPVMDVRLRFGRPEVPFSERTCIIITRVRENDFGLIVDEVDEVADIQAEQISPLPRIGTDMDRVHDYLTGIAQLKAGEDQKERVVLLIHVGKILGDTELSALAQAMEDWQ
jgi:purine-binding chemotaxis protein CheW